ncbi:MAG: alpha/beta hydrolase [Galactobacter sp.]
MTSERLLYRFHREPVRLRPDSVLPAQREDVVLHTQDGLDLVGELALPAEVAPKATLVLLHPLPTHGGFMDSHVYRKAAYRLPALADVAVLRFNTRGTSSPRGVSQGHFEEGEGERFDVAAALDFVAARGLPDVWLVGWSFGTELVLRYGSVEPNLSRIRGAVLLSPPLHRATTEDLDRWEGTGLPLTILVPELDDYLRPPAAQEVFGAHVPSAHLVPVEGAKHLWVGEKYVQRVHQEIVDAVLGAEAPSLPAEVTGLVARA